MQARLTDHARVRMQQRGIRTEALEVLLDFGRVRHLHVKGRELVYLDRRARSRLAKEDPDAARAVGRGPYAVIGRDGVVITVGHRYRRVPRG